MLEEQMTQTQTNMALKREIKVTAKIIKRSKTPGQPSTPGGGGGYSLTIAIRVLYNARYGIVQHNEYYYMTVNSFCLHVDCMCN